ncbi:hypothetical protein ACFPN7_15080 [Amycolatopsis halotolerans]
MDLCVKDQTTRGECGWSTPGWRAAAVRLAEAAASARHDPSW